MKYSPLNIVFSLSLIDPSKKFISSRSATISSKSSVSYAVKTVTMTIDSLTASKVNSIKLKVSSTADFTNATEYSVAVPSASGDVVFNVTTPATGMFYQIEINCAQGSSNGLVQVSKIVFAN